MHGRVISAQLQPVPNVMVSDGISVTSTAHDGTFSLSAQGPFVFVTRPAGFRADPWFVPSTMDSPIFTLIPDPEPFPYKFIHVSDTHLSVGDTSAKIYPQPAELGSGAAFSAFLSQLPDRTPDVSSVIATGDLTDLGLDAEFAELRAAVDTSPVPVHLLPGNHDHMSGEISGLLSRNNYMIHTGDPAGYERNLGPRWYSFELPGLHVVALDWHTHEIGLDHELQDAWLRADLESIPSGTPWILLSHDQPWRSILDGLPWQPIATFSGHRHTSRVVEVNGTLHVNTPTPLFAALDYSPPSFRVVTWDGDRIGLQTRTVAPTGLETATFSAPAVTLRPAASALWRHQLPGGAHRAPVRVDGGLVLAGVKYEDRPAGGVDALDLDTGGLLWRADLRSAVKGTPVVHGEEVIAVEVSGDVVSLDRADGAERWRIPSPDPLRLFAWADPVIAEGLLIVGDMSHLRAIDLDTGELRWERRDLFPYQTLVGHAAPVLAGETLVVGVFGAGSQLSGLDVHTGQTKWPVSAPAQSLGFGAAMSIGTPLFDVDSGDMFVPAPGKLARVSADTGDTVWTVPMSLPWNPATPVSTPDGIATVDSGLGVALFDRAEGTLRWETPILATSDYAMASYRRTPHPVFASATLMSDTLLAPGLDGHLYQLSAATGDLLRDVEIGAAIAAPAVVTETSVLVVSVDGSVTAVDRKALT